MEVLEETKDTTLTSPVLIMQSWYCLAMAKSSKSMWKKLFSMSVVGKKKMEALLEIFGERSIPDFHTVVFPA